MDDAACDLIAQELQNALRTRMPIDPIRRAHPGLTVDDAYAIQLSQVAAWQRGGRQIQGHKIGLTSAVMQRQLGVDQPDYGHLHDTMFRLEGLPIALGEFISPKVEPELAFVLKRPLAGPGVNVARALSAIDYVVPAIEIIDSRIRDWDISLVNTVADNASSGGVVLGSRPVKIDAVELRLSGCVLTRRGAVAGTGPAGPCSARR